MRDPLESVVTSIERKAARILGEGANPAGDNWVMYQSWRNLLFLHWKVDESKLREIVPGKIELDSFEGQHYITMIPMHMVDVHVRGLPPVPTTDTFPEVNFRTYVRVGDLTGVYFFSIDADSLIASWVAEHFFKLPYVDSDMTFQLDHGTCRLTCDRASSKRFRSARFVASWQPEGTPHRAKPGTLEHFLVERYAMFSETSGGVVWGAKIKHLPWEMQQVKADVEVNTVPQALGLELGQPDHMAYSERTDTLCWAMAPV